MRSNGSLGRKRSRSCGTSTPRGSEGRRVGAAAACRAASSGSTGGASSGSTSGHWQLVERCGSTSSGITGLLPTADDPADRKGLLRRSAATAARPFEQARRAYHDAIQKEHPDRGGSEEQAKCINAAWDRIALLRQTVNHDQTESRPRSHPIVPSTSWATTAAALRPERFRPRPTVGRARSIAQADRAPTVEQCRACAPKRSPPKRLFHRRSVRPEGGTIPRRRARSKLRRCRNEVPNQSS